MATPAPVAIGVLDDTPGGMQIPLFTRALALAFAELARTSRVDRSFELLIERANGLPTGTAQSIARAHAALVSRGALVIVGPAIGDNALAATPCADAARVATLNWAGSEEARSQFMFQLQVGSHEEEPLLLARHLAQRDLRRCALVFERSAIGSRYAEFFEPACLAAGVETAVRSSVSSGEATLAAAADAALRAQPDAVVYLGLGAGLPLLRAELARRNAAPPLFANSSGMFGWVSREHAKSLEGVSYVDVVSESNPVLAAGQRALGVAFSTGPMAGVYLDLARLAAEGIARAPVLTAAGVAAGLERIKLLPAALGGPGTQMGFGRWERSAYKGDYLVLRRWRGGESRAISD
jgi:ABC-type branched-subunit amino acid transport system substrate-binding protein